VYDTLIVGGGVAGLTAALFAARSGLSTLVLVPGIPGGQLATIEHVEDFPGFPGIAGYELGPTIQEQAANAGAEFQMVEAERLEAHEDGWQVSTGGESLQARTVILAMGSRPRRLGVPGEERLEGRGISHCASCDGPLLRGKRVTVVGGGDSGLQEALTLAEFAATVDVIHRSASPTAQAVYQQRVAQQPAIVLHDNTVVEEILGEDAVAGVRVRDLTSSETSTLESAALFVYVGLEPNSALVQELLRLDEGGHVPTDLWMRTERAGLLAAGDLRSDSAGQAITAAGDGATAALAASRYLHDGHWLAGSTLSLV